MDERRKSFRQRMLLSGRISNDDRCSTMDCTVRDLTDEGARLSFGTPVVLAPEFDLSVAQRGLRGRARVIWRKGAHIGVEFIRRESVPPVVPLDLVRQLARSEQQKSALRRRVNQLSS